MFLYYVTDQASPEASGNSNPPAASSGKKKKKQLVLFSTSMARGGKQWHERPLYFITASQFIIYAYIFIEIKFWFGKSLIRNDNM